LVRRRVGDPGIRPLIDRLASLVLEEGSVNRAQQRLTEQLAADRSEGHIYPNRLHALLSEDPAKSVNPATLRTIETALGRLPGEPEPVPASAQELQAKVAGRWPGTEVAVPGGTTLERVHHLAADLNLPPAVVSLLLGDPHAPEAGPATGGSPVLTPEPDWSFQDVAYERCLQALEEGPSEKVGLVLPTGGGKTRLAIRILLQALDRSELESPKVIWVTHRTRLRLQATRELQRAIGRGTPDLPARATALLAGQVEFCMLSKLRETLDAHAGQVALVVVDEAHHAAAASYAPIFDGAPLRGLFLTATPNRTDLLPIGIDRIAYSATYRDLFDSGVIVEPRLDELTIPGFDWRLPDRVEELADYLLGEAQDRFRKTLVAVSRVEHAETLHEALLQARDANHVLGEGDIGFVHGGGSSNDEGVQDFLDEFQSRPRGILVATSQLLGEGFDDPSVDSAVVTYATQSLLDLMQVAGRCMRYAPGKDSAHVVQIRDSALAYHWEQGWLYQDISDLLRPRLESVSFGSDAELVAKIERIAATHNVSAPVRKAALSAATELEGGEGCSLLLTGLPYSGPRDRFDQDAKWGAILVTPAERDLFLRVFNAYSERRDLVNDRKTFLEQYVSVNRDPGSRWRRYMDMLAAMDAASAEVRDEGHAFASSRPSSTDLGTNWLLYVTLVYEPSLPAELDAFLADAINREAVAQQFLGAPQDSGMAIKVPLPLGGTVATLISSVGRDLVEAERKSLRTRLGSADQRDSFAKIAAWQAGVSAETPLPQFALDRFERFLPDDEWNRLTLILD